MGRRPRKNSDAVFPHPVELRAEKRLAFAKGRPAGGYREPDGSLGRDAEVDSSNTLPDHFDGHSPDDVVARVKHMRFQSSERPDTS